MTEDPLKSIRKRALERVHALGSKIEPFMLESSSGTPTITADFSSLPSSVQVLELNEAMPVYRSFLQTRWTQSLEKETDLLCALNLAVHRKGLFIYVPPSVKMPKLRCTLGMQGFVQIHIVLGVYAEAEFEVQSEGEGIHACIEVSMEEGSRLKLHRQMTLHAQQWHETSLRASLKRNAYLESLTQMAGGTHARACDYISLLGEGAEAQLKGLAILRESEGAHAHWTVDHKAPHTRSLQRFKTVLYDYAKASFEGKIRVSPEAQKTEAYQLNNNLLLSEKAVINSRPNLEIFADDVKASHGVTIAEIDPQMLFYLASRGISQVAAKQLLADAFCQDLNLSQ